MLATPSVIKSSNTALTDPRLRRNTIPLVIKPMSGPLKNGEPKSGVLLEENRVRGSSYRPPSPPSPPSTDSHSNSFTPPPPEVVMEKPPTTGVGGLLSADDLKQLMTDERILTLPVPGGNKSKSRLSFPPTLKSPNQHPSSNHPNTPPVQKIPSTDFEGISSPEYRPTSSSDLNQQNIGVHIFEFHIL